MSTTEHTIRDRLQSCLHQYLSVFESRRTFFWINSYASFTNPGIEVGEHGLNPLPLGLRHADTIKEASRNASSGTDKEAVPNNTWALDPSQFRMSDLAWKDFLNNNILAPISETFALKSASVKLRKLLLYGPGSFVKWHEHLAAEPEIISTIFISLPSGHEGGNIKLSFERTRQTFPISLLSKSNLVALAWLGDVSCEIEELVAGHRFVLAYDIVVPKIGIDEVLSNWRDADCGLDKAIYPLNHRYRASSLSLDALRGYDKIACQYLQPIASKSGFSVFLARMTQRRQKVIKGSNLRVLDYTKIKHVYSCRGNLVAPCLDIGKHELPSQP